jgi:hypothetical protein
MSYPDLDARRILHAHITLAVHISSSVAFLPLLKRSAFPKTDESSNAFRGAAFGKTPLFSRQREAIEWVR